MKLTHTFRLITAVMLLAGAGSGAVAQNNAAPMAADAAAEARVVYHVSEAASLRDALNNITNHLSTNPGTRIVVLANSNGVYALVNGERDRQGEYGKTISGLQAKGVKILACSMSMQKHNIAASSLLPNVSTVASGVVELTRLQTAEHYAYIKP